MSFKKNMDSRLLARARPENDGARALNVDLYIGWKNEFQLLVSAKLCPQSYSDLAKTMI